jgi:putative ABC transport system permease protein
MARQQAVQAKLGGDNVTPSADDASFDRVYTLDMIAGTQHMQGNQAVVFDDLATQHHWQVGSRFALRFPGGHTLSLTVVGIAKSTPVTAPISIPMADLAQVGVKRQDTALSILVAPGADPQTVHSRLDAAVADLPIVSVQDKGQFAASVRGQVNQLLYLIYGLLGLAVIIAVFGIVNTLGLSVIERTRELGLLRAIGVSRVQLRGMVTLESVAIALLGAVLGLVLGVVFGVLLRQTLSGDITSLALPLTQLLLFLGGAVAVGVLAAVLPAVRASHLDVLRAIATE